MKVSGKKQSNDKTFHPAYQLNEEFTLAPLKGMVEM